MMPVVESQGVKVHCPECGRYSFFNSPYPMHRAQTGVDVYPGQWFGEIAPSPVEGEILKVRRVRAPTGRGFVDSGYDVVTLIRPSSNPSVVLKLLHVDTVIGVGDRVQVGDELGVLLRSGYYGWGTSPHVHVEVRSPRDPLRARGGYELRRVQPIHAEPLTEIAGSVVASRPEFAILRLDGASQGLVGDVEGARGLLDGGIPYYGWMGVHMDEPRVGAIRLLGVRVGEASSLHTGSCVGPCGGLEFTLGGTPLLGLSLYLTPVAGPLVKAIPRRVGGLDVGEGDWVEISLNPGQG
jgi:hypothetical protein